MSELMFPKPKKKKKGATREQDSEYVRWIHGWTCVVPGCITPWPVHAHHATTRARGGSDRTCVPLCMRHHVGDDGIHIIGQITFQKRFMIDLELIVLEMQERFGRGEKGTKHYLLPPRLNKVKD